MNNRRSFFIHQGLSSLALVLIFILLAGAWSAPARAQGSQEINITFEKHVLSNGLTVILHEDHKAPIVAFNVWYHVGSKNEKPGKTGFAHLFEHLMFNGSEHYNDDFFKALQQFGTTDINGTTNEDRTNYFETVPVSALDLVLWLESDRMGHLKGAIDQAKLDEQRGVVQNELRQYANEPYSIAEELLAKALFPAGHPYSWTVGGSIEDLDRASLQDVQDWFSSYYGPNNAVVVIAGDINPREVLEKVKKYFGSISPLPPVARHTAWVARRSGEQRQKVEDRVSQARIYLAWNIPQWGTAEADYLDLASSILGQGKNSRLYKRLVYEEQIASSISAYVDLREIAGIFFITADARPGVALDKLEQAIKEELARFLKDGPEPGELQRVRTGYLTDFIRGIEKIGGFSGKCDILARSQVFGGRPDYYQENLKHVREATPEIIKETAKKWLADGVYVLEIHPYPQLSAEKTDVDRSRRPEPSAAPPARFPQVQKASLSNGLKIILAERHTIPYVRLGLMVDAGYAADQLALPGTAYFAMQMLDEGTARRSSLQISEELALLGAELQASSALDFSYVSLGVLKENLDPALDIYADVILNPSFPQADFQRLQKIQIARIQQEKFAPTTLAIRVLPKLIFGQGHAYGNPLTGSGYEETVLKIKREDLIKFHKTWFKPNHSTLVVTGDVTMAEIKPRLEKIFKDWQPGDMPRKNLDRVSPRPRPAVYLIDKPGAPQSMVMAGLPVPSPADPDDLAMDLVNYIFGGDFVSRINMNIREEKHWSYGAFSVILPARAQRPFVAVAPVQLDKTRETILELTAEMEGMLGKKPVTREEFQNALSSKTNQLPGQWETMAAVESSLIELANFQLPDDYFQKYATRLRRLQPEDLNRAARKVLQPNSLVWVVVGDRSKVEKQLQELGLGQIVYLDGDGNLVK
ncbi:MAG: insulinase family protein [Candidatus Saccharicenans sp.]|jgi:zinc protease|nr:insulinase family protein [Candidatus Saccharicenans sp.]MDH7493629.1 pitrilysin family protein [Candidatus Saccharicenans sp.]